MPIPPQTATAENTLPTRAALRAALAPHSRKSTPIALAWTVCDLLLFTTCLVLLAAPTTVLMKLALVPVLTIAIARLFIIGHDACHQSLTRHRLLNRIVGRIAFLPSLTPYSPWEVGHNHWHHAFTNLRGKDYVWVPYSPAEYLALPSTRRVLERIYRGGFGHALYYLIEIWWKKLFFPSAAEVGVRPPGAVRDGVLVSLFAAAWVGGLAAAALGSGQSAVLLVTLGFVLPFALWNVLMGVAIYIHHTDPQVVWFDDAAAWAAAAPYITLTVHAEIPLLGGRLLHDIMRHPAHHLDMGIPLYRLARAQAELTRLAPGSFPQRRITWAQFRAVGRRCQVFDYAAREWRPFPEAGASGPEGC